MPWGESDAEMDVAFRRIRKLMKFDGGTAKHYVDKIREFKESLTKKDGRPAHLIKDKFPQYWDQKYSFAYELWKGQLLRSVWRDRRTGRIITYGVTDEDIRNYVLTKMESLEVHRIDRDYKKFTKVKQERLMRPGGLPRY